MKDPVRRSADRGPQRVTLADVAIRAGVSAITVSRALRRPQTVSEPLRRRIESAARELAYVPNRMASALASARTNTIGVVIPSLTNGVFGDFLRGVYDVCTPQGLQVVVANSRYSSQEEERSVSTMLGHHPDGMIVTGVDQDDHVRRLLGGAGIPVVQTFDLTPDPIDINIGFSHRDAGYAATRHLLDAGHRVVGVIAARMDPRAQRRVGGYREAVVEFGVAAESLFSTSQLLSSVQLGGELLAALLAGRPDLEAVFCCNDDLALGALFECHRRGIAVPGELSIIGFNDLDYSACAFPALTTVATPRYRIGQVAAETILRIVQNGGRRPRTRSMDLGFEIRQRQSTQGREVRRSDRHGAGRPRAAAR